MAKVVLGKTQKEHFSMVVAGDPHRALYPAVNGGVHARIVGPDASGFGKYWEVDGIIDSCPPGTEYEIVFSWGDQKRSITWEPSTRSHLPMLPAACLHPQAHADDSTSQSTERREYSSYSVSGSFSRGGKLVGMKQTAEGIWEAIIRITARRAEDFTIVCEHDPSLVYHPAEADEQYGSFASAITGPDANAEGKSWHITGRHGEKVMIRLLKLDTGISVEVLPVT